jgi:hypothetical protein
VLEGLKQPETLRTFFAANPPCFQWAMPRLKGPNVLFQAGKIRAVRRQRNLSVGKTLAQCLLIKMAASSAAFFCVTIGNDAAEIAFEGALRRLKHPLASIERLRHFRQPLNPLIREHASLKTPVPVP